MLNLAQLTPDIQEHTVERLMTEDRDALYTLFEHNLTMRFEHLGRRTPINFERKTDGYRNKEIHELWVGFCLGFTCALALTDEHEIARDTILENGMDSVETKIARNDHKSAAEAAMKLLGKLEVHSTRHPLTSTGELSHHVKRYKGTVPMPRLLRGEYQVSIRATAH
jgi:hypothetical protein